MKYIAILLSLLLTLLQISGCATQQAFQKGKSLLAEGKVKDGLEQLHLATDQEPRNLEIKSYYYRQRESWVSRYLREAETARINGAWEEASQRYQAVLEIDPLNDRALSGLKSIETAKQNEALLAEANELYKTEDYTGAHDKLRQILVQDAANTQARSLLAKTDQKIALSNTPSAKVNSKFKKFITLELKDTNIKTAFELISKAAGINFILDKEIRSDSKVSIFVKHTTIEEALKNILSSNQLSKKVLNENSVLVYPNSKKGEYEENVVRAFYLNSVDVKQVQNLIKTIVKTKDIFIDDQMNILVMRDTPDAVRLAEKVVAAYDVGDPEVLLDVEVLEVTTDKLTKIGAQWPSQVTVGVAGAAGGGQLTFDEAAHFNSSFGRITVSDPALILNLLGTAGESNLLANPHIRVKNHKKAKVHIGDRVPVITSTSTSTGFVSESVNYLDVGLKLNVEASIMVEDEVNIDVGLEVSNIVSEITSKNGTLTYRLGTRNASTTLKLKNGETQILAGLINDEDRTSSARVPGIADLPILGRLFASKQDTHTKTEIILLITPKIVRNITPPDYTQMEFSSGTESGNAPASMMSNSTYSGDNAGASMQPIPLNVAPPNEVLQPAGSEVPNTPPPMMPEILNIPPPPPLPGQVDSSQSQPQPIPSQ